MECLQDEITSHIRIIYRAFFSPWLRMWGPVVFKLHWNRGQSKLEPYKSVTFCILNLKMEGNIWTCMLDKTRTRNLRNTIYIQCIFPLVPSHIYKLRQIRCPQFVYFFREERKYFSHIWSQEDNGGSLVQWDNHLIKCLMFQVLFIFTISCKFFFKNLYIFIFL